VEAQIDANYNNKQKASLLCDTALFTALASECDVWDTVLRMCAFLIVVSFLKIKHETNNLLAGQHTSLLAVATDSASISANSVGCSFCNWVNVPDAMQLPSRINRTLSA
jgi:hypothetical protein